MNRRDAAREVLLVDNCLPHYVHNLTDYVARREIAGTAVSPVAGRKSAEYCDESEQSSEVSEIGFFHEW